MPKLKTSLLNGSPNKQGTTAKLFHMIEDSLQASIDANWINVFEEDIITCIGCMQCRPDKPCALPVDDGHQIEEMLHN